MTWPDVGILDAVLLFHLQPFEPRLLKAFFDQNSSGHSACSRMKKLTLRPSTARLRLPQIAGIALGKKRFIFFGCAYSLRAVPTSGSTLRRTHCGIRLPKRGQNIVERIYVKKIQRDMGGTAARGKIKPGEASEAAGESQKA